MKSSPYRQARRVIALVLALTVVPAQAQLREEIRSRAFSEAEWSLLPEWCIDTQQGPYGSPEGAGMNRSPRAPHWVQLMGTDFWHMHHYCRGLTDLNRLNRPDLSPRERAALMESAINEFKYIIRNCKPTMPLMPEAFLRMGDVYVMRKDFAEANVSFEQARRLKPDYWPAYSRWADVLIGLKQFERARALLEEGLAHSPQQAELLQRLRQAGGSPRPVTASTTKGAAAAATLAPAASKEGTAAAQPAASSPH